ncbi:MAG: hypothetical protein JWM11_7062 [Planctomycetaceae bacterium]|nr:hypothetical protein [Planctomycetaceae bacterium]
MIQAQCWSPTEKSARRGWSAINRSVTDRLTTIHSRASQFSAVHAQADYHDSIDDMDAVCELLLSHLNSQRVLAAVSDRSPS